MAGDEMTEGRQDSGGHQQGAGTAEAAPQAQSLGQRLLAGDRRALARAISYVENGDPRGREVMEEVYPAGGRATVVGITGAPGVGKSTLLSALVKAYRDQGQTVAVVAVDPSSPFSGGALLGDRIRMDGARRDEGVFFRSIASRGQVGGLSRATWGVIQLMDAAGYDLVLVETVGAGQSEVEIMRLAHTVLVVTAPGLGDEVQAFKAGILEIGDILVVNKADRPGADRTAAELAMMLDLTPEEMPWRPPLVSTVARSGEGLDALMAAIQEHLAYLEGSGRLAERRRNLAEQQLGEGSARRFAEALREEAAALGLWDGLVDGIAQRQQDPDSTLDQLLGHDDLLQAVMARVAASSRRHG